MSSTYPIKSTSGTVTASLIFLSVALSAVEGHAKIDGTFRLLNIF